VSVHLLFVMGTTGVATSLSWLLVGPSLQKKQCDEPQRLDHLSLPVMMLTRTRFLIACGGRNHVEAPTWTRLVDCIQPGVSNAQPATFATTGVLLLTHSLSPTLAAASLTMSEKNRQLLPPNKVNLAPYPTTSTSTPADAALLVAIVGPVLERNTMGW